MSIVNKLISMGVFCVLLVIYSDALVSTAVRGDSNVSPWIVTADGRPLAVMPVKIAAGDNQIRWREMDDLAQTATLYDTAFIASITLPSHVSAQTIAIRGTKQIHRVTVLPASLQIKPTVSDGGITFVIDRPEQITIEFDDDAIHSLHLFVNPPQSDVPDSKSPDVIYFAPGVHEIRESVKATSGQTIYVADGAVLKGAGDSKSPLIELSGQHVTLCGRGVIDGGDCPTHSRNLVFARGSDLHIEGVTLIDSPTWNFVVRQSEQVTIDNIKILGHRSNSDGIDICNSRDVTVKNCFLRTLDDLIVIKTDAGQGPVHHVRVEKCVLWNQVAHALSIGAELREPVDDVIFHDCDVIHDIGREWTLRIFNCDSAMVKDVHFENIRIAQSRKLISLWIGNAIWSRQAERGHIADVSFENIFAEGSPLTVELIGVDPAHAIDGVSFSNILRNGKPLTAADIQQTGSVHNVRFR